MTRPSWQYSAPCASADPDAWFPDDGNDAEAAKQVCAACPFKAPCLLDAIERSEQHGVWGGVPARHFKKVRAQLGIQRVTANCGPDHARGANRYIDPSGRTRCRTCSAAAVRQARASKRGAA